MSNPIEKALAWFNKLPTWQKVALGVAVLGVASGGGFVVSRAVVNLNQGDPKFKALPLGHGGSSIGTSGCILTCVTMAANALAGKNLTVVEANEIGKTCKAFTDFSKDPKGNFIFGRGVNLAVGTIAPHVGLKVLDTCAAPSKLPRIKAVVDGALKAGGLAILHVDYGSDGNGEHFILVNGKTATGYTAADPATGKTIPLDNLLTGTSGSKTYKPVGAKQLVKA